MGVFAKSAAVLGSAESSMPCPQLKHCDLIFFLPTELSTSTAVFAKSAAMLGNVEEHTTLSRALSQLAETEEKIETVQKQQADTDFYVLAELLKDYIALIGSVKVSVASVCWVDDLPETRMMINQIKLQLFSLQSSEEKRHLQSLQHD